MTQQTFDGILESNNIHWNNLVRITIINPYRRIWQFSKPQVLVFDGALDYTLGSNNVGLYVTDDREFFDAKRLCFEFEQILGIKKIKNEFQ